VKKIIIAYVPVIHQGYIDFFKRHSDAKRFAILDSELIKEFTVLEKEIRQIDPHHVLEFIKPFYSENNRHAFILYKRLVNIWQEKDYQIIIPSDSISRKMVAKYFPNHKVVVDTAFLKWDEDNVYSQKKIVCDEVSDNEKNCRIIKILEKEALKSSCWWRHNAAAFTRKKFIIAGLIAHNEHLPSEHSPYINGDPRDFVEAGKDSHIASSIHAEQIIVAKAAEQGTKIKGTDLYTLIFPCPMCAKIISKTGIKRLYFKTGHASLDGLEILKAKNIKIIQVK